MVWYCIVVWSVSAAQHVTAVRAGRGGAGREEAISLPTYTNAKTSTAICRSRSGPLHPVLLMETFYK